MSDAIITVRGTDVKDVKYRNNFTLKPGERMDFQVKTNVAVKTNVNAPTNAIVIVKFETTDKTGAIVFTIETMTAVQSSTFIEDFEGEIKAKYMNAIMMAINEKIRAIAAVIGLNVSIPAIAFGDLKKAAETDSNIVPFETEKK